MGFVYRCLSHRLVIFSVTMETRLEVLWESGCFGRATLHKVSDIEEQNPGSHYSSVVKFIKVSCIENDKSLDLKLVVKTQLLNSIDREIRDCDQMFINEVEMYNKILPEITREKDLFSKVFYAYASKGSNITKDIIILNDLSQSGYSCPKDIFLDYDHIKLAIIKLAKFHSYSYYYKMKNRDAFSLLVGNLKETWFREDIPKNIKAQSLAAIRRGIHPIIKSGYHKELFQRFMNSFDDLFKVVRMLKGPKEPFGLLCHGDYVPSNLLFRYEAGVPRDMRMIDFQNALFSTPVLDLSKFLYTVTDGETRQRHWDALLDTYWSEFEGCLPGDVMRPSRQEFLEHFAERAVYGYVVASFTVPMQLESNQVRMEEYRGLTDDEKATKVLQSGGEIGTAAILDILQHMHTKGYITKYLQTIQDISHISLSD